MSGPDWSTTELSGKAGRNHTGRPFPSGCRSTGKEEQQVSDLQVGIVGLGWVAGAHIDAFKAVSGAQGDGCLLAAAAR